MSAALHEFAARGFDGAKVDRIARDARVNKAMLYYHFNSKAALFIEILRTQFGAVADAVEAVRSAGGSPEEQLRAFVDTMARQALTRPHFPHMWLREIADGGRHVDASVDSGVPQSPRPRSRRSWRMANAPASFGRPIPSSSRWASSRR